VTIQEMLRSALNNIEAARAALEDGAVGYVLHNKDHTKFICQDHATLWFGSPLDDRVQVYTTHTSAVVAQRYWNSVHSTDDSKKAIISLRREAIVGYIDQQQHVISALLEMGAPNEA
jgi:hypothetical protein